LTGASFLFYGWADLHFVFFLLWSGAIGFFSALAIVHWPGRKTWILVASLVGNIAPLAALKYLKFICTNLSSVLGLVGLQYMGPVTDLILPLGISFYTFQSMSYTIDVFQGRLSPTKHVFHFFAYLSMFPHLLAGPILRAAVLLPQLDKIPVVEQEKRWEGTVLIAHGYFKKAVVADTLAPIAAAAFARQTPLDSCAYWWTIMVLFSFQIYCDFSGYSDIACGLAKWMGYEFPLNFDHPYLAGSTREFWTRWHISLSMWFRDYVYIPLGGSRTTPLRAHVNMWVAMVLSGLWHGAAWTFIAWGALHASFLSIERLTNWPKKMETIHGGRYANMVIVFLLVLVAWVFFRAQSLHQAVIILSRLISIHRLEISPVQSLVGFKALFLVALMVMRHVYVCLRPSDIGLAAWRPFVIARPVYVSAILLSSVFLRGPGTAFIYFGF